MAFLLCSAPHADTFGYSMPPPGLLRLGGYLKERGFEVRLEDLAFRLGAGDLAPGNGLADSASAWLGGLIQQKMPRYLGLSTMGATLPIALAIAERVRRAHPTLPILLGGPGTNGIDGTLVTRFAFVDAVLCGEGEAAVAELLARPDLDFEGIAGFTWRDDHGRVRVEAERVPLADLDEVSAPAWGLLPSLAEYKQVTGAEDGLVPVDSGRGCVFDCSFCSIGRYWKRRSRTLPAARLADEIEALSQMEGARQAYLCHDIFGADRKHALAFCADMKERREAGRALPFEVRARLDHLDDVLVDAMAAAGCYRVLVGIESASPRVRGVANKELRSCDNDELLRRVTYLAARGITPILSLILGLPGEQREDLIATLEFLSTASKLTKGGGAQLSLHLVNPQPGCALGEEYGTSSKRIEGIAPDMALGAGDSQAERELIGAHPDLFSSWHLLTGLPGGEEHLHYLRSIASEVPEVLMRYPQTHAALAQVTDQNTLQLFEERSSQKISFESQARRTNNPTIDALLAWEQAKVRTTARKQPWRQGTLQIDGDKLHIELPQELLQLPADIAKATDLLAQNEPLPSAEATCFLVNVTLPSSGPSHISQFTSTLRISKVLHDLLAGIAVNLAGQGSSNLDRELLDHLAAIHEPGATPLVILHPNIKSPTQV